MAKVTQVSVSYSYTFNLGNYSSVRPEVSLTAELEEGDSPETVQRTLLDTAKGQVEGAIDDELIRLDRMPHFDKERGKSEPDEVAF
jgi:hypothetical protein